MAVPLLALSTWRSAKDRELCATPIASATFA
jgi:hypothetical protein